MRDIKTLASMIKQINYILTVKQRRQMFVVFFVILIGSMFELLGVSIILPFIQALLTPEMLLQNSIIKKSMAILNINSEIEMLIMVGCGIVVIYFLKNLYLLFSAYVQTVYSCTMQEELSVLMYKSYLSRPYSFFVNSDSGEIMRGVMNDAHSIFIVIQHIFKFLAEIMTILAISVYLVYVDVIMAMGILFIGFVTFLIIILVIKRKISVAGVENREANANTSSWTIQSIEGIKDIFVFSKRKFATDKYEILYDKLKKSNISYHFIALTPDKIIETLCISGIIITVMIRILQGVDVERFVPALSIFAVGAFKLLPCISHATGYVSVFIYSRPAVESAYDNVYQSRKYAKEIEAKEDETIDYVRHQFKHEIIFKDVCFRYEDGKKDVLHLFNLKLIKGSAVGIVGESGAGKSTLADLLMRLYKPKDGQIMMDGKDINQMALYWSDIISYVPQTVFLISGTIRDNVAFGEYYPDDKKIWQALRKASLDNFVEQLPDQLDTIVGERGVKFSGGQRQRIAIARALYRNPDILILDEATSALDNDTENAVMEAIDHLHGSMTLIIIAHRLSTIQNCDMIYEIKNGYAVDVTQNYRI